MFKNWLKAFFFLPWWGREAVCNSYPASCWSWEGMDAFQTQQWHFCTLTYHLESRESEAGRLLWCMFHPELHVEFKAYLNYREKSHHTHTQRNEWMGIKFTLLSDEFYMDTLIDCIEVILYWETALVLLMIRSTTTLWNVCVSHFTSVMEYNKWLFCKRIYQQRFKMLGKKSEIF